MKTVCAILFVFLGIAHVEPKDESFKPPNIVIIMGDDVGFDDLSLHGQKQHLTPNIDALGYYGMSLNHFYAGPMCTPSRATFLTGKYPSNTGTQHSVIANNQPWSLAENITTIAQVFRDANYATHLIGKWDLGFAKKHMVPTRRGFDTFFGYWGGVLDYYQRRSKVDDGNSSVGYDLRRNMDVECANRGVYFTDLLNTEAEAVIDAHNEKEKPLFLVVTHLAGHHTGNYDDPLQAPEEEIKKFDYIEDEDRRKYAAMLSKLDESVGNITRALHEKQILNNTILIFFSDNGAPTVGTYTNSGSNWPMRGQKNTPWEGGVRVGGAIWSPLLKKRNILFQQKMSVVDWLPTLAGAAKIPLSPDFHLDGLNLWDELVAGDRKPFDREIIHMLDDIRGINALMNNGYKYINGVTSNGSADGLLYHPNQETDPRNAKYASVVLNSTCSQTLAKYETNTLSKFRINNLRKLGKIKCGYPEEGLVDCDPIMEECLFDINKDPCERNNLSGLPKYGKILKKMRKLIEEYRASAMKPLKVDTIYESDPSLHGCRWTNYLDEPASDHQLNCTYTGTPCSDS